MISLSLTLMIAIPVAGLLISTLIFGSMFSVGQQEKAIIERFGKYKRTVGAGLNFKFPIIDDVNKVDMQIMQSNVDVETKTKDDVFTKIKVGIQFCVVDPVKAYYQLSNPEAQLKSYVYDVVRAQVPKLTIDETFIKKDDVAMAVKGDLAEAMDDFGFKIINALIIDIDPDEQVKKAMNEINAQSRLRQAAAEKAEAEKITVIKQAEAEAASKALQGKGIADQRKAIIDGLRESVHDMSTATGATTDQVMSLILTTQYFDALSNLAKHGATTIMIPHQPGVVGDVRNQMLEALNTSVKK